MQVSLTFKNIEPSDHLKSYVTGKLNRLDRFLDNPAEAAVMLQVEKHRHICEVNISGDRLLIIGKEETDDMYSAIDMVMDKLEKQIKKNKEKIRDKRGAKARTKKTAGPAEEPFETPTPAIKVESIDFKPMDVEEAAMQLDLVNNTFIVFTNARTNRVNVIYKRKDGDYGLIQPSN